MNTSTIARRLFVGLMLAFPAVARAEPPEALPGAHAHNDYYHKRPLWDALDRGFTSIEADVFLVDGQLLVGHYEHELRPERTLEALYLKPLQQHVERHQGRVFRGEERLALLVDFKTDGKAAYTALSKLLEKYADIVSQSDDGAAKRRAIDVIVTGDRPIENISADKRRFVAIDGRLVDLSRNPSDELMPLVSESWASHFSWRGEGEMPEAERRTLREMVETIDRSGRRLRFWGTPDDPVVWKELRAAGVHVIGADDLEALRRFLNSKAR